MQGELKLHELTFGAKAAIVWGFMWRGALMAIASMMASAVLAGVVGAVLGAGAAAAGAPRSTLMSIAVTFGFGIGAAVGAVFLYFMLRWVIGARLGGHRLVLVKAE